MTKTTDIKNDNNIHKPNAFEKVCNTFFNYVADKDALLPQMTAFFNTCIWAKRNLKVCLCKLSLPTSHFQKSLQTVNILFFSVKLGNYL